MLQMKDTLKHSFFYSFPNYLESHLNVDHNSSRDETPRVLE